MTLWKRDHFPTESNYLFAVKAPTLLIVGGNDDVVVQLNEQALRQLQCHKELVVVPGATHLFEELGTLEEVAHLAKQWFVRYLASEQPEASTRSAARR